MADNVTLEGTLTSSGSVIRTDDDATAHWQYVKAAFGADGTQNIVTSTATNPLPVALSDTDNAVLDTIEAVLDTINAKFVTGTVIGDVNLGATDNAVLDAIAASLVTIDLDTNDIRTAAEILDNSIFADDAAFTLTSSSVNMAGAIRDDSLSTLTAIEGDATPLRVSSTGALHVTGGGGGSQYNIDTALGGTDSTTLAGVVRDDSLTTLTEADGDVSVLRVSSTGALHVTGGGGGTEYSEDVASPATQTGTATMMERDDALATVTPIEGDWIGLRGTAEGALWTQDYNSDAILVDTSSIDGKITACDTGAVVISSGTVTANLSATDNTVLDNIQTSVDTVAAAVSTQMQVDIVADGAGLALASGQLADGHNVTIDNASGASAVNIQDGGNTITVDGTVTANLSATDNAVLDSIVVNQSARATGGHSYYTNNDTSAVASVKASAGTVYWISCMSIDATPVYLNLYDVASGSVTLGTTTPDLQFIVPTQGDANGAGFTINFGVHGIDFATAITVAAATTYDGSTDPGANVVITNIGYE